MNKNLVTFSLFLVVLGLAFDLYLVSFLGLLLLIPALATPSRPPARPVPTQTTQQPRRVIPREPPPTSVPTPSQTMAMLVAAPPAPAQQQPYASALFPTVMFPSLSVTAAAPQPPAGPVATKQGERDELLEVGAMVALMKLVFG